MKVNSAIRGLFTFAWELVVLLVIFPALETITSGPGAGALSVVGGVAGGGGWVSAHRRTSSSFRLPISARPPSVPGGVAAGGAGRGR